MKGNNRKEAGPVLLNNHAEILNHMDLQWFAEDPPADPPADPGDDPGNEPPADPPADPGWMAGASKELKEKYGEDMRKHDNISSQLSELYALKEKSSSAIFKPGKDATDEEVAAYKEAMNIPLAADDYEFDPLGEGQTPDENTETWARGVALKANLDKDQAKIVYSELKQLESIGRKAQAEAMEAARKETEKEMRQAYGKDYEITMAKTARVVELGGPELKTWMNETGAGNRPDFIRAMARIGSLISEDSLGKEDLGGPKGSKSAAEVLYG